MKAMLTGFAAIALVAVAASYGLGQLGFSSQAQATGDAVRLSAN